MCGYRIFSPSEMWGPDYDSCGHLGAGQHPGEGEQTPIQKLKIHDSEPKITDSETKITDSETKILDSETQIFGSEIKIPDLEGRITTSEIGILWRGANLVSGRRV